MSEHAPLRERMVVEQLEPRGISDARVLDAMRHTPREKFLDPGQEELAYADQALPIAEAQTISQPYVVALMAQAAALSPADRVLEVGAGSGYGAAVLGRLASRVWTIERSPKLARRAGGVVAELGLVNVTVLRGDGARGWPPAAPFDAIIVTAAARDAPPALREQLAIGGRLIIPLGRPHDRQRLVRIIRKTATEFEREDLGPVAFAPLEGG